MAKKKQTRKKSIKKNSSQKNTVHEAKNIDKKYYAKRNLWNGSKLVFLSLNLLIVIIGFTIYSNVYEAPFVFDDIPNIVANKHIHTTELSWESYKEMFKGPSTRRLIPITTVWLNYYFSQEDVFGYHLVNVIIHVVNGLLLFNLFILFLRTFREQGYEQRVLKDDRYLYGIAFSAAMIWYVHPVQTQSVTYIIQRINSIATMFYLSGFICYLKGRSLLSERSEDQDKRYLKWFIATVFIGVIGLFTKEIVAMFFPMLFVFEWFFYQKLDRIWFLKKAGIVFALMLPAFAVLVNMVDGDFASYFENAYGGYPFTLTERLLTETRVLIFYLTLLFFPLPSRLTIDYDFTISTSIVSPLTTLISILTIIAILLFAYKIAKKERIFSFVILWYFMNLFIESSVFALDIIFEHRLYLPSTIVILGMVILIVRLIKQTKILIISGVMLILLLCVFTYQRNKVWGDTVSLWSDNVEKSGDKARVRFNLGNALFIAGKYHEAVEHYTKLTKLKPDSASSFMNLGVAYEYLKNHKKAIENYKIALKNKPDYAEAHMNYGIALENSGDLRGAIREQREALKLQPDYPDALFHLADALMRTGKLKEAIPNYNKALKLKEKYPEAHNNIGVAYWRSGKIDEAIRHFKIALKQQPGYLDATNNLKQILIQNRKN